MELCVLERRDFAPELISALFLPSKSQNTSKTCSIILGCVAFFAFSRDAKIGLNGSIFRLTSMQTPQHFKQLNFDERTVINGEEMEP